MKEGFQGKDKLEKIKLRTYILLTLINLGAFVYLVLNKDLLVLTVFPLVLINQAALYFVVMSLIESAKKGASTQKILILVGIKIASLIAIVLVLKQFRESFAAIVTVFLIQTAIFAFCLKSAQKS